MKTHGSAVGFYSSMDDSTSIQHLQMLQATAGLIAAGGTFLLALLGRWIGGVWTTLVAITAAVLLTFHPLINAVLFSNLKTDRLQMILSALIPFTVVLIGISFRRIPIMVHVLVALLGPAMILAWALHTYGIQPKMPPDQVHALQTALYLHHIIPIAIAVFLAWLFIELLAARSPGLPAPITIALLAMGCTFLLMLSAESNAGLMATPIPATAAGAAVATLLVSLCRKKPISFSRGPVLLWLTILGSLFGYLWISDDQLPQKYLGWLACTPLLAWVPEIGPIRRTKPWIRESIRFVLITIPVVATIAMAYKEHRDEAKAAGDEFGMVWPQPLSISPRLCRGDPRQSRGLMESNQSAAPMCPSQMPMPNTIPPPTIT